MIEPPQMMLETILDLRKENQRLREVLERISKQSETYDDYPSVDTIADWAIEALLKEGK